MSETRFQYRIEEREMQVFGDICTYDALLKWQPDYGLGPFGVASRIRIVVSTSPDDRISPCILIS